VDILSDGEHIRAGSAGVGLGAGGACLGILLQTAGSFQGLQGGLQFLVSPGGLGVRDGGSGLGAASAGVGVGQLRADLRRIEPGGFGAGVPGQRGGLPQYGIQPGQGIAVRPCRQAVRLRGHGARVSAAGAAGAGGVVVGAGARIAAVLPRPAMAGLLDRGAAAGPTAVSHQVTGLAGGQHGLIGHRHRDPLLSFLFRERKRKGMRGQESKGGYGR
jgi:hypothetical protein